MLPIHLHFSLKLSIVLAAQGLLSLTTAQGQVKFGLSAGGTASYFGYQQGTLQSGESNPVKAGFNGGIKLDIPLSDRNKKLAYSVVPELFIIQNGASNQYYTNASLTGGSLSSINLNYVGLYLPVKLRFQPDSSSTGIYLLAAGFIDHVAGSSAGTNTSGIAFVGNGDKTDFGFRGAFGLLFPPGGNRVAFGLELGYNEGLNKIQFYNPAEPAAAGSPNVVHNSGFTLSVSAFF
jgi:hypothetical protein